MLGSSLLRLLGELLGCLLQGLSSISKILCSLRMLLRSGLRLSLLTRLRRLRRLLASLLSLLGGLSHLSRLPAELG